MLILTRKIGEKIVIDGDITITVMEVGRGGQVRLGLAAPRHHRILRHELLAEIEAENRGALAAPTGPVDLSAVLARLPKPPPG